jgi:membrane protein DedA with SNARE-associated domain
MAGVPQVIIDLGWWAIFIFLTGVVFMRAQFIYWLARWVRARAADASASFERHPRLARASASFSGPGMTRAQAFLDRWGYIGIPVAFPVMGFQTMVNAAAGYTRMRWDLYTAAMLPGCIAWAAMYSLVGMSLVEAWRRSPWLFAGVLLAVIAVAGIATRLRRNVGSDAHTPQSQPIGDGGQPPATARR